MLILRQDAHVKCHPVSLLTEHKCPVRLFFNNNNFFK
jgi:hypothetical protein